MDALLGGKLATEASESRLSSKELVAGLLLTFERLKRVGDGEDGRAPRLLDARTLERRGGETVPRTELAPPKPASTGEP